MKFYDDVSYHMNRSRFWKRQMQELLEDTMGVVLLQEMCFTQGCGGPPYIIMWQIIRGATMSANAPKNHHGGKRCRWYHR